MPGPAMSKSSTMIATAVATLVFAPLAAMPAFALSLVTFVSGKGVNTGTCATPANPCRTFNFALAQTAAGGEIKALDASSYGSVTIDKSLSITGVEGASIIRNVAGNALTINAGASGVVTLSNLTIDGFNKTGSYGVFLTSAASLTIRNCAVRNFANDAISLRPTNEFKFLISESVLTDNGASGVYVTSTGGAFRGDLDHVAANKNVNGVWLAGSVLIPFSQVTVVDSIVSNNANNGLTVGWGSTVLHLTRSTAQLNTYGVRLNAGQARSAGNNSISANVIDVSPTGALINVGTQ